MRAAARGVLRRCGAAQHEACNTSRTCSTGAIFRDSAANKQGLSHALDGTMRGGAHDMKVFGAGTLRALATRDALAAFLHAHWHVYRAMEEHLDASRSASAQGVLAARHVTASRLTHAATPLLRTAADAVWASLSPELRRAPALAADVRTLRTLGARCDTDAAPSPATAAYVARLAAAAQADALPGGPPLLLAHAYVRYFADLFGGSMLGAPTQHALGLPEVPRFYIHPPAVARHRRAYVERAYNALNAAGASLSPEATERVVAEAHAAFACNGVLYREGVGGGGAGMYAGAVVGGARVVLGTGAHWLGQKLRLGA
jgi:heme oxygenase